MDATKTDQRVVIEVSDDRLQAWIRRAEPDGPQPLTVEEIVSAVEEAKIVAGEHMVKRINEFLAPTANDDEKPERCLVAEGRPCVECLDEIFHRNDSFQQKEQDWQGDSPVNYYTYNSIHLVEKDDAIGTLERAVPGLDGVDVLGKILPPRRRPKEIKLDASVRKSKDDPTIVLATSAGQIDLTDSVLSIKEIFTVAKDLDFATGNIDSPIDVQIHGTVQDGFVVKSHRGVTIGGAIESAEVEAKGDILVHGGILQKGKHSVKSGGDIVARFCTESDLHAAGNVKICKVLMSSRVQACDKLLSEHGAIIGGYYYAREGVEAATLGSDANVKTEIVVGMHPDVVAKAELIRASMQPKRDEAERIRRAIQPLLAEMKRLSPAQKEKVTELMFKADEMDADIEEAENKCLAMLADARAIGIPYVMVSKIIHQGVMIRMGRRITMFDKTMHGPVRIEKRKIRNVTEFVAINQLSGSIAALPSSYVSEKPNEATIEHADAEHGGRDGPGS